LLQVHLSHFYAFASAGILFSGCLYVLPWLYTKILLQHNVLINCLREFHQLYNLGAVVDKDEPIRFWAQSSR